VRAYDPAFTYEYAVIIRDGIEKMFQKEIKIPDIAENVETGLVAGILVSKGDKVSADQPLVEIETNKATTDIPSPYDGVVDEIMVKEGGEVKVNQVIMIIEVEGEEGEGESEEKEEVEEQEKEKKEEKPAEKDEEKEKEKKSEKPEDEEDTEKRIK
jgi:pyruvate dehydrogenase E2 component (dihydrolipoamide acetyltransferase)